MDRPLQKPWETPSSGAVASQSVELKSDNEQSKNVQKTFDS